MPQELLHKGADSSLGTQALHLWKAVHNVRHYVTINLIRLESEFYNMGNRHIHLHAGNQLTELKCGAEQIILQDQTSTYTHTHTPL